MPGKPKPLGLSQLVSNTEEFNTQSYNINARGDRISMGGMTISKDGIDNEEFDNSSNEFKFNDIDIHEQLGHGASSIVYKGKHIPSGTLTAMKKISVFDRSKRHQLLHEIQTLYNTESKYIVHSYGTFFHDGHIFISLEYMNAGSLQDILDQAGSIPEQQCAYFARCILAGLAHMKERHHVHRDIKPSNVCLNMNAEAKLADFGISTTLDNTLEQATTFVGTNAYMSPERIVGNSYSFPGDIWSVGIMLVQMATGKFPFPRTQLYFDFLQLVVNGPSPSLPTDGKFSSDFRDFVGKCLEKDPVKRGTAEQLLTHPFITKQKVTQKNMQDWIKSVVEEGRECGKKGDHPTTSELQTEERRTVQNDKLHLLKSKLKKK